MTPAKLLSVLVLCSCADRYVTVDPDARGVAGREVVLRPEAVLLDDRAGVQGVAVEARGLRIVTDGRDLALGPGHVVVGRLGGGYLRRVVSVQTRPYGVWVGTEAAALADVLLEAHVTATIVADPYRDASVVSLSGRSLVDWRVWEGETGEWVDVEVWIDEGWVSVEPTFDLTIDVWGGQTEIGFETGVWLDYRADFVAEVDGALHRDLSAHLVTMDLPFSFWIGPVPVVGEARVAITGGVDVDADGAMSQTLDTWAWTSADLSAGYDGDWYSSVDATWDAGAELGETQVAGQATVRAYLQARIDASLYGLNSPYVELEPWVRADATPCDGLDGVSADFTAGLEGLHGYEMDVWGWDLLHYGPLDFASEDWDLGTQACP